VPLLLPILTLGARGAGITAIKDNKARTKSDQRKLSSKSIGGMIKLSVPPGISEPYATDVRAGQACSAASVLTSHRDGSQPVK